MPPEPMAGGASLGLKPQRDSMCVLVLRRGNGFWSWVPKSMCRKLVGHYPIAEEENRGDKVVIMRKILERTRSEDPVRGNWHVFKSGIYGVMLTVS